MSSYDLRRAGDRRQTETEWLHSAHSFAFGQHYQPDNLGFGPLIANNEDLLRPGPGYPMHPHRDTEILTWLIEGELVHVDAAGRQQLLRPGMLQLISAGSGIVHSERSASADQPVRLVQMWLSPDESSTPPGYACADFAARLASGELVLLAGSGPDALALRRPGAALLAARQVPGQPLRLPVAERLHLFVCAGSLELHGESGLIATLRAGDAVRITGGRAEQLIAGQPSELLVWQFDEPG